MNSQPEIFRMRQYQLSSLYFMTLLLISDCKPWPGMNCCPRESPGPLLAEIPGELGCCPLSSGYACILDSSLVCRRIQVDPAFVQPPRWSENYRELSLLRRLEEEEEELRELLAEHRRDLANRHQKLEYRGIHKAFKNRRQRGS